MRPPDEIEKNRTLLNRQYDEFKKYGHINNQTNRRIFLMTPKANRFRRWSSTTTRVSARKSQSAMKSSHAMQAR